MARTLDETDEDTDILLICVIKRLRLKLNVLENGLK